MPLTREEVATICKDTVIESITSYIKKRANKQPNFQILDLIIPTERRIRSVVGGMETALGTTLWEPLAKNLAGNNGFEIIKDNLRAPANMPGNLANTVQILTDGRHKKRPDYTAKYCHDQIKNVCQEFIQHPITDFVKAPRGFGVDIWLKKDDINYFFDTKTVKPNVGTYSKCFSQLLNWYAYFYSKHPEEKAFARIVFPYNPYSTDNFWSKTIGKGRPLEPSNEGWVENEFWDFCSGVEGTYEIIHDTFKSISDSKVLEEKIQNIFYD